MNKEKLITAAYNWFEIKCDLYIETYDHGDLYLHYDNHKYAEIVFNEKKEVYYGWGLWEDFSLTFSTKSILLFELCLKSWVEKKYGLKPSDIIYSVGHYLRIPT